MDIPSFQPSRWNTWDFYVLLGGCLKCTCVFWEIGSVMRLSWYNKVLIESSTTSVIEKSKSKRKSKREKEINYLGCTFWGWGREEEEGRGGEGGGRGGEDAWCLHKFKKRGIGELTLHVLPFWLCTHPKIAWPFDHKYLWCKAWV